MNRRTLLPVFAGLSSSRIFAALLIPVLVATLVFSGVRLSAESAGTFFKHGQTAEAREDFDTAYDNYLKAAGRAPADVRYRAALARIRVPASALHLSRARKLDAGGETQAAIAELLRASEIDPSNEAVQQEIAKIRAKTGQAPPDNGASTTQPEGKQAAITSIDSPMALKPLSTEPLTLHMTEDAKVVYQAVGKAAGINILFDPDYTSKRIPVDLNNVSLLDALRIVGTMSNTFWKPVTANTIFVAQNSRVKRTELDEQAVQTFYLTNAWQQNDMNDVQTALRNVMPNAKVYGVASQNAIVMRGTPDELLLAQKLIDDLDKARAEVVVDIAIMEVSKNWEHTLGISWPSTYAVAMTGSTTTTSGTTTTTSTPTIYDFKNASAKNLQVTVGSATLNLLLSDSDTKILQSPRIRATDAQKATMKIGSRIPIATGSYSSGTSSSYGNSLVNTQFQYQDIGVNIEMTPTIHYDRDVTLKLKIEISSHSGDQTISGVTEPIISQRVVDQVIRLREGEASILGGIQDKSNAVSWSGIPGLSSIPLLKYLFGSKDNSIKDDEIVFVVVPHIVRAQDLGRSNLRAIDTGSSQSIELRRIDSSAGAPDKPASTPQARPTPPVAVPPAARNVAPNVAPIAAPNAEAAVSTAMAQMRDPARTGTTPPAPTPQSATPLPATQGGQPLSFSINVPAAAQLTNGGSFQVPILLSGGSDVTSVPLQLHYDSTKLALANVVAGDLLSRDGQAVGIVHRDDNGNLNIVVSRPPNTSGINGSGVVCVLTFQARATGAASLAINRASTVNSTQQPVAASPVQVALEIK
ncbi:MAG: cohesin domain-containing protein [Terracidiphilus sp.]|nr:cohesin domain-containing protein [Terracidiphilus sp.]